MATRTTRKYEVVHNASGTVVLTGICKTEATKIARKMSGNRKGSVIARPVKR